MFIKWNRNSSSPNHIFTDFFALPPLLRRINFFKYEKPKEKRILIFDDLFLMKEESHMQLCLVPELCVLLA